MHSLSANTKVTAPKSMTAIAMIKANLRYSCSFSDCWNSASMRIVEVSAR